MIFSGALLDWYINNYRDLPWRKTNLPYNIWVSEIILQQTRVNQGINYYYKFIDAFPTIFHLANASIEDLMKIWEGLGYYSRARNMHSTAKKIAAEFRGEFPGSYKELIKLKGIGPYTAAAIASICFKEGVPVVDGNVFRVLSRYFGIPTPIDTGRGKKEFFQLAAKIMDKQRPHIYNQAIMELGAMVCTSKKTDCLNCPLNSRCYALARKSIDNFPVKSKKPNQKTRYFFYLIPVHANHTYISQRKSKDIWHSLHEFPLMEFHEQKNPKDLLKNPGGVLENIMEYHSKATISTMYVHLLTHQKLITYFIIFQMNRVPKVIRDNFKKTALENLEKFAFPKLINRFLTDYSLSD